MEQCKRHERAPSDADRNRPAPAAAAAQRLPPLQPHHHPLDGQRRLRARQQRRLLQLVRHGGEPLPDRGRRARRAHGAVIGLVVETHCNYFSSLAFPQPVDAGLRVSTLGASSVRYEIGLFAADAPLTAACRPFRACVRRPRQPPPDTAASRIDPDACKDSCDHPTTPQNRPPRSTRPSPRATRCAPSSTSPCRARRSRRSSRSLRARPRAPTRSPGRSTC